MAGIDYLDFDIELESTEDGYVARVLSSPTGEAEETFELPFSSEGLENFILKVGRARTGVRRIGSPQQEAARAFGTRLYDAVFSGEIRTCFRRSLDEADRQRRGLRVRLRMSDAPGLAQVPWEYLYSERLGRFLVLSAHTPIVRYLDLPDRVDPLAVTAPLRVLLVVASPGNLASLDTSKEVANVTNALAGLTDNGLIELTVLESATLSDLRRALRTGQFHVLHFVGHGGYDERSDDGVLVFESETGGSHLVSGHDLGTLLHDHRTLRLAVLNACEGARGSADDPFSGVAQSLVRQRIPAVVAMQFEITDAAAILFSHELYLAVLDGYSIDAALAEARKAIFTGDNDIEWGTPVLYMRARDGRVFDISADVEARAPERSSSSTELMVDLTETEAVVPLGGMATAADQAAGESVRTPAAAKPPAGSVPAVVPPAAGSEPPTDPRGGMGEEAQPDSEGPNSPASGVTLSAGPYEPAAQPPTEPPAPPDAAPPRSRRGVVAGAGAAVIAAGAIVLAVVGGGEDRVPESTTTAPQSTTTAPAGTVTTIAQPTTVPTVTLPTTSVTKAGGEGQVPVDADFVAVRGRATVDGSADEWGVGPAVESSAVVAGAPDGPVALWRLMWDEQALYLVAETTDSVLIQPWVDQPAQLWRGDSVHFELGPSTMQVAPGGGPRSGDAHYLFGLTPEGGIVSAVNPSDGRSFVAGVPDDRIEAAGQVRAGGYLMEIAVPWDVIGVAPGEGVELAVNLNVSDVNPDGSLGTMRSSNPARTTQNDPNIWQVLVLG